MYFDCRNNDRKIKYGSLSNMYNEKSKQVLSPRWAVSGIVYRIILNFSWLDCIVHSWITELKVRSKKCLSSVALYTRFTLPFIAGETQDIKFLCLQGTVFDQETRVCERSEEVACTESRAYYDLNKELYQPNSKHHRSVWCGVLNYI